MEKQDLLDLISLGESQTLEFKESFSSKENKKEIKLAICAFANADGGKILVGVRDDGSIMGVNIDNNSLSAAQQLGRAIDPKISVIVTVVENVLVFEVFASSEVHSCNSQYSMRMGSDTQKLGTDEVRSLFERKNKIIFEDKENILFNFESDFSFDAFDTFLKLSRIKNDFKPIQLLENIGLVTGGVINNAGVLFFCKNIYKFFKNATVQVFLYKGKSDYDILDSKDFKEDLFSNFKNLEMYLHQKLNTEYVIESTFRKNVLELPEVALREALLNSFSHRDYNSNANIQVHIYWDKVEIINSGGLPSELKVEDLGKKRFPRNILICDMFQRMDLVEKAGSGIKRIIDLCLAKGLREPSFEVDSYYFKVIFWRSVVNDSLVTGGDILGNVGTNVGTNVGNLVAGTSIKKLSKKLRKELILKIIEENDKHFSQRSFAEEVGVDSKTIERDLKELSSEVYYNDADKMWKLK